MKKTLLALVLAPVIAFAQTYPSPTFNSLTLQNPLTAANGGTGATTSTGAGSVVLGTGPTLTGPVTVNGTTGTPFLVNTSGSIRSFQVKDTAVNGANFALLGNGSTTPSKTIRVQGGTFGIVNDAYSAQIFSLTDAGSMSASGGLNSTPVGNASASTGSFTTLSASGSSNVSQATPATSSANQNSPNLQISGNYWNGSASAADGWFIQNQLGTGANPTSTLSINHAGSSNTSTVSIPNLTVPGVASFATISAANGITSYKGIATVANGVPSAYAQANLTAQTGSVASSTLYSVPAGGSGFYLVVIDLICTNAGTGGTVQASLGWNNGSASLSANSSSNSLSMLGNESNQIFTVYSTGGQNITYSTAVSGAAGSPQYSVRIRLFYLG